MFSSIINLLLTMSSKDIGFNSLSPSVAIERTYSELYFDIPICPPAKSCSRFNAPGFVCAAS